MGILDVTVSVEAPYIKDEDEMTLSKNKMVKEESKKKRRKSKSRK